VWDEESGVLHRELEGFGHSPVSALATFLSPDGQQARLVAGSDGGFVPGSPAGQLRVYDPEAGSVLHRLKGHNERISDLACIASSSAAPNHPIVVSACQDGTARVWDGETGERVGNLRGHMNWVTAVAVWTDSRGGSDRIATRGRDCKVKIWDGESFKLLRTLDCRSDIGHLIPFRSAEGAARLLVARYGVSGVQVRL
jgi:WD40 repeat protein